MHLKSDHVINSGTGVYLRLCRSMCGKAPLFRRSVERILAAPPLISDRTRRRSRKDSVEWPSEKQSFSAHRAAKPQTSTISQLTHISIFYGHIATLPPADHPHARRGSIDPKIPFSR